MCGILFLYDEAANKTQMDSRSNHALQQLTHRGPDDEGLAGDENWRIGHKRLSIIDLSSSRQPMSDINQRFWLTYNGEIYNYKELRHGLESHWTFRSNGDTEVILAGLVHYGESFIERMEGMWAFALWDKKDKSLLLSRDRIGKKPLYYQETENFFSCSSEIPALRYLRKNSWAQDQDSLADYLRYGFYHPGTTIYKGVLEVLPGHNLLWSPGGKSKQTQYWRLDISNASISKREACDTLRNRLHEAVKKRLVADVEIGAFLSGGIDSSLIIGILSKEFDVKPKTFTIGFKEEAYDERHYARQVSKLFSTDHKERCLDKLDPDSLKSLINNHVGQPFSDSSLLPTAMVSQLASEHVKVALSGDGADEMFSGYQRYHARSFLRVYSRLPRMVRNGFHKLIRTLPDPFSHHSRSLLKKAHLFLDIVERREAESPYIAPTLYSLNEFANLVPELASKGHSTPLIADKFRADDILEMMVTDALIYLPQDILVKIDRASMAFSLEIRSPFLDHKVIELAFSLPVDWHRDIFGGKRILKNIFFKTLPMSIWKRRKQGFAVPVNNWFRNELSSELKELLLASHTPLNKIYIESMLDEHLRGRRDNGHRLWNIFVYLFWEQTLQHV